jgi:hypothetical protein
VVLDVGLDRVHPAQLAGLGSLPGRQEVIEGFSVPIDQLTVVSVSEPVHQDSLSMALVWPYCLPLLTPFGV